MILSDLSNGIKKDWSFSEKESKDSVLSNNPPLSIHILSISISSLLNCLFPSGGICILSSIGSLG